MEDLKSQSQSFGLDDSFRGYLEGSEGQHGGSSISHNQRVKHGAASFSSVLIFIVPHPMREVLNPV